MSYAHNMHTHTIWELKVRIGINVPNELLQKVKQIKPEVNVSQICREALRDHVESYERAVDQADSDGVDQHLIRLADSNVGYPMEPDWEALGFEDARDWIRAVTPEIWEQFTRQYEFRIRRNWNTEEMFDIWSQLGGSGGYGKRVYENNDWFDAQCEVDDGGEAILSAHEKSRKGYSRAWLGYVLEVKRRLEQHRMHEYEKLKAEWEKYRQSSPDVELPPLLI